MPWQTGVLYVDGLPGDLLAFTLDKTGGAFSPTTRYRDYAISRDLIHGESQSVTRADREAGRRYLEHAERGSQVLLFARLNTDERPFHFLGPARYVRHESEQPMGIIGKLDYRLSGEFAPPANDPGVGIYPLRFPYTPCSVDYTACKFPREDKPRMVQMQLSIATDSEVQEQIATTLARVREALHRRGRLASRNEALEELSKLLFAHVVSILSGGEGLHDRQLGEANGNKPKLLREFVRAAFEQHLPQSLSHELPVSEFALRLKNQEDELAAEVIAAFDGMAGGQIAHRLTEVDLLNEVFGGFLVDSFANEKELGQYLTPPEVVKAMVHLAIANLSVDELETLVNPDKCGSFGSILDPSCGVGSFLTETLRTLRPEVRKRHGAESARVWAAEMTSSVLVGVDKSERMIRLALANLALYGAPAANLHLTNALDRRAHEDNLKDLPGNAALILTNPPFGAEFEGADLEGYELAEVVGNRKVNSEVLFLERYLEWLKPGGQLLAIVPDSILTNRGPFQALREHLGPRATIINVISLPAATFSAAGTTTKTSILHLRKGKDPRGIRPTYFAICEEIGFEVSSRGANRTKVAKDHSDLPDIIEEAIGSRVPVIGRRVEGADASGRWDATYHASLPHEVEQRIRCLGPNAIKLRDVAELVNDRFNPRTADLDEFHYIEISGVDGDHIRVTARVISTAEAPTRARRLSRPGDVVISTVRPENRAVGVIGELPGPVVCTTGLAVLRPKMNAQALAMLLRTPFVTAQILRNNLGVAYPAVDEDCLPDVVLPIEREDIERLSQPGTALANRQTQLAEAHKTLQVAVGAAVDEWKGPDLY